MTNKKISLIIDTNWFVSAAINRKSRRTLYQTIIADTRFEIFYSNELLTEYNRVIARKKFSKYVTPAQANRLMVFLLPRLSKTQSMPHTGVRDVKDNYLIGMCKSCKPDFLITGDVDLLILETFQETTILTMGQFLQLMPLLKK